MIHSKKLVLGLGGAALLASVSAQAAALHDGIFDGGTYDAYFGPVQVELTVQGGKVVSSKALQKPDHRRTSVKINDYALPLLEREVVMLQNAKVHMVSGATLTSAAYRSSVADAINQALK